MTRLIGTSVIALFLLAVFSPVVRSGDDMQFIKVEVRGTIKTHVVSARAERPLVPLSR